MSVLRIISIFIITIIFSSCANMTSIYRELDTSQGKGALIDIKQRAIISGKVDTIENGEVTKTNYVVCAEPSPDAMSALSAAIASDKLGLAGSLQEGAAFVGLRTQSIQLLRDAMYRYCEMYMNGGISKSQYQLLLRRNQRYMVALLAIEQLTGAIKVPAISISTQGSAQLAKDVSQLVEEKQSTKAAIIKQNDANQLLVTELATVPAPSAARKLEITNEQKVIKENIDDLKKNLVSIDKAIASARGAMAEGSATVVVNNASSLAPRSDTHIKSVADNVTEITKSILDTDDLGSMCLMPLLNGELTEPFITICTERLNATNTSIVKKNELLDQLIKKISHDKKIKKGELQEYNRILKTIEKFGNTGIRVNKIKD
jgi:hypothetical protein